MSLETDECYTPLVYNFFVYVVVLHHLLLLLFVICSSEISYLLVYIFYFQSSPHHHANANAVLVCTTLLVGTRHRGVQGDVPLPKKLNSNINNEDFKLNLFSSTI